MNAFFGEKTFGRFHGFFLGADNTDEELVKACFDDTAVFFLVGIRGMGEEECFKHGRNVSFHFFLILYIIIPNYSQLDMRGEACEAVVDYRGQVAKQSRSICQEGHSACAAPHLGSRDAPKGGMRMKRNPFTRGLGFLLVLAGMALCISAQQRQVEPVRLEKLSDRLFQILGGRGANGGFYIGDDAVLVIDAKMTRESVEKTVEEIKKLTDQPIKYLVNTHSDGDHVSGNKFFPPEVIIIAHENCRKEFFHPRRNGEPSEWTKAELAPFLPSITFREKMDLYLGSKKVELWYFGVGHTTGDAVVYFPEEKVAFLGDQIFIGRPQLIHAYKGGNSFLHVRTLTNMLHTLEAELFCSGHAQPVDRKAVEDHIREMKRFQGKIIRFVEQGLSLEEIKKQCAENEARLAEVVFNEVKAMKG